MELFTGCATALVTPFRANGTVSYEALRRLVRRQLESGVSALVVNGTTGEAATLTDEEMRDIVSFVRDEVNGQVPVIAGAGSNNTSHAVKLAREAAEAGADALLVVTPYYNKTSENGLAAHFEAIADAGGIPVILYNVPGRSGMSIPVSLYPRLGDHHCIVAVKEASGNVAYALEAMEACGDKLTLYSGNDDITLPLMAAGAKGVISVASNVAPRDVSELCRFVLENNLTAARRRMEKLMPLVHALFSEVNPIPVKEAMNILGLEVGCCRAPLAPLDKQKRRALYEVLQGGSYT